MYNSTKHELANFQVSVKRLTMRTPQENRRTPTVRLATEPVMSERLERLATPKNMNSG